MHSLISEETVKRNIDAAEETLNKCFGMLMDIKHASDTLGDAVMNFQPLLADCLYDMMGFYQKLQTLNKLLESESKELVAGVVEVEAVGGVFLRDLGVVGVEAELMVEVENGNIELLRGLLDDLNVSDECLCVGALDGSGRGSEVVDVAVTAARGSHKDNGLARIVLAQEVHKEVNAAAESRGGLVADLSEGSIAVDIVVYAAVNNDHISGLVHIVNASAEAEIVTGLFACGLLMSQTGAADAVIVDL